MISLIQSMLFATVIYEYPNGQFHYCFEDYIISINGFDGIAYTQNKDTKRAYSETKQRDSCFYLNKHFNETSTSQCSLSNITVDKYALLYKKGGCSVGMYNKNNEYTKNNVAKFSSEILTALEPYNLHNYKYIYSYTDEENIIFNQPLGTSHFCFDNVHVSISGYDNIVYGENTDSKSAYSFSSIEDSCANSVTYFNRLSSKPCNLDEKTIRPLRSYGHCFISINNINITLAETFQDYLIETDCYGCKNGFFHQLATTYNNSTSINSSLILVTLFVIIITIIIC